MCAGARGWYRGECAGSCGFATGAAFRFVLPQENGLPHQCAHWFAMTCRNMRRACGCKDAMTCRNMRRACVCKDAMICNNLPGACVCKNALPVYCRNWPLYPQKGAGWRQSKGVAALPAGDISIPQAGGKHKAFFLTGRKTGPTGGFSAVTEPCTVCARNPAYP